MDMFKLIKIIIYYHFVVSTFPHGLCAFQSKNVDRLELLALSKIIVHEYGSEMIFWNQKINAVSMCSRNNKQNKFAVAARMASIVLIFERIYILRSNPYYI